MSHLLGRPIDKGARRSQRTSQHTSSAIADPHLQLMHEWTVYCSNWTTCLARGKVRTPSLETHTHTHTEVSLVVREASRHTLTRLVQMRVCPRPAVWGPNRWSVLQHVQGAGVLVQNNKYQDVRWQHKMLRDPGMELPVQLPL